MDATVSDRVLRITGGALLIGALLEAIGAIAVIPAGGVGSIDRSIWVITHLFLLVGATALLVGLPGLYFSLAREIGRLGLFGGILAFVGSAGSTSSRRWRRTRA